MIDPKLINYIRNSLGKNIPVEEIKKSLLSKGWQESIVNGAINLANQNNNQMQPRNSPKQTEVKTKKESSKIGFVLGGIFIFALLIGVIGIIIINSSEKISDTEFSQGIYVSLEESKEIRFDFNEEEHKIQIFSVNQNSVNLIVQSNPVNVTLSVGETKKFDLDSNDFYDLSVRLNSIADFEADLYIVKINEPICTEGWNCTSWGVCENLSQARVCEDLNNCGTEKNKPIETQECEDLSCTGQGGILCSSLGVCNGIIIESSDGVCCSEDCIIPNFIECEDIDCLITTSDTCHKANLTYDFTSNILGWVQTNSRYYEILGLNDGKCELYEKVLTASGEYGDTKKQSLLEEGNTEAEITALEDEKNAVLTNITGLAGTCRYSTRSLNSVLVDLETYGITLTITDAPSYECTGDLYNASYW